MFLRMRIVLIHLIFSLFVLHHLPPSVADRLNERVFSSPAYTRNTRNYETNISPLSHNEIPTNQQRQSRFFDPNQQQLQQQQVAPQDHLRASGLILPANNQAEVNNYKESYNLNHPTPRIHQHNAQPASNVPHVSHTLDQHAFVGASTMPAASSPHNDLSSSTITQRGTNLSQTTDLSDYHHGSILEMALRQVNSDEGLFQPSPALIVGPSQRSNWPPTGGPVELPANVVAANAVSSTTSTTSTTTTDQSNNILSHNLADYSTAASPTEAKGETNFDPMSSVTHHELQVPLANGRSEEYQQSKVQAETLEAVMTNSTNSATTALELPNHVFYEGPATAPPTGNYFFSSSEKLPNNDERASNAWWLLGFGTEFEKVGNLTKDDYRDYCSTTELLVSNKQRTLCKLHPKVMPIVARGIKMAIDECQTRFSTNRWNCSLVLQNSLSVADPQQQQTNQLFGDVMKQPNRERSFLNAILAAGLAHAMTKACSQGELPEECSCDKKIKSKNNRGKIEWVACSDDIDFGARFSRDFTDQADNESDATSMINTHNYEVGRRVFKSSTDITCTCQNGENGLCQTKRCWKHLGPFTDIGDELTRRYESATHVQMSTKDPHKLRPVRRGVRKPKRKDLVYIDESPDYCSPNARLGVLGTQNRRCNSTSMGSDSCSLLCCGRGYQVIVEEVEEDCNCKFVWCCQVKCEKCRRQLTNDVCN